MMVGNGYKSLAEHLISFNELDDGSGIEAKLERYHAG